MREIKFRAWDNKRKIMIDELVVIDLYNEYVGYLYQSQIVQGETVSRLPINDVIIMQSTGLFDKNGKEIFEGDIVNISSHTPFYNIVKFDEKGAAFQLYPLDKRWSKSYFTNYENVDKERFEVIGNIFEDGDLIDG